MDMKNARRKDVLHLLKAIFCLKSSIITAHSNPKHFDALPAVRPGDS